MIVRSRVVGPFAENSYIVGCPVTREGALIDPGGDVDALLAAAKAEKLTIRQILLTHGHWDHVFGVGEAKRRTGATVAMHPGELPMLAMNRQMSAMFGVPDAEEFDLDVRLAEGDVVRVGDLRFDVLFVPGHSPAHVAFSGGGGAFVGDTVMAGTIGRTDLPGGSMEVLRASIVGKIMTLPPGTALYPGHGPATTVRREREQNPFVLEWM
ncbi:MAG: MBL fold metallo-hydrolase [Candidatus Brocadiae bacterium]|nr:MBL fold metallo-hydrolase [Candidatus Brocadiia bacterium]